MIKRLGDVIIAIVILILAAPLLAATSAFIKSRSRGPIFFRQRRVGRDAITFEIFKFRTMHVDKDRPIGQTKNTDAGVFPGGALLRRSKIDELPQLLNVIRGDMSLVGPRPCLPVTVEEMPDWAHCRFRVRPGMTGLAQINGNISLNWEERWRHDVDYTRRKSLSLDLAILVRTVAVVVLGEEVFRKTL